VCDAMHTKIKYYCWSSYGPDWRYPVKGYRRRSFFGLTGLPGGFRAGR
jgi:hypothetical protein